MKVVAGYGRVSTLAQVRDGTSAEEQERRVREECERRGFRLLKFYRDDGFSGKTIEHRPGIQALIEDAKRGKFEVVMFTKLDRLARNLRELLNVWQLFEKECGLEIICIEEPAVNTSGRFGKMMLSLLGAFAEFERETIAERTRGGRKIKWQKQETCIGQPPYGYRWDQEERKFVIVPEQQEVYNRIVSLYLYEGYSFKDIAIQLTHDGVPTPSQAAKGWTKGAATHWSNVMISKILKNPAYTGKAVHNVFEYERHTSKTGRPYMSASGQQKSEHDWVEVTFPPLISREQWELIQRKIKFNTYKPKRTFRDHKDHFVLDGLIWCGECGGKVIKRVRRKPQKTYLNYLCYWHNCGKKELEVKGRQRCDLKATDADRVDALVYDEVVKMLLRPSQYFEVWLKDQTIEDLEARVKRLEEKKQALQRKLEKGYQLITAVKNEEVRELHQKAYTKDLAEFEEVQTALRKARTELQAYEDKKQRIEQLRNIWSDAKGGRRLKLRRHFARERVIREFLYGLPFEEKKRVVTAIIAPEAGGRVVLRWPTVGDLCDGDEAVPKSELGKPLKDREPVVDVQFTYDAQRVVAVISGLKRDGLLDKFNIDRISHGKEDDY